MKIGPIPMDDGVGKEIITRMTANMATDRTFYTDSNGRDFLKRVLFNFKILLIYYRELMFLIPSSLLFYHISMSNVR